MSKKTIAWVAVGITAATAATTVVLWWAGTRGLHGEQLVTARFDALRTGLSIGLGGGGLFALYLAWRRQHSIEIGLLQKEQDQADVARAYDLQKEIADQTREHQRRVADDAREDAVARRITELYTKASDLLGSDKAPVRMAGLYALERLAQSNPDQRQPVVNVLCAYLRVPFTLPDGVESSADQQELQVRITAQTILRDHLYYGDDADKSPDTFWHDIDLDLTGATLVRFDLNSCQVRRARFTRAVFTGDMAAFDSAVFVRSVAFDDAQFETLAIFSGATFQDYVSFSRATFHHIEDLWNPIFRDGDYGPFYFHHATFRGYADFGGAVFHAPTSFGEASFEAGAYLTDTTFHNTVSFRRAAFDASVVLWNMVCHDALDMTDATVRTHNEGTFFYPPPGWEITSLPDSDDARFRRVDREDESEPS